MPVERVAGSPWNEWPDAHGIGGRITVVRADKPICKIATTVRNAAGELCLTGSATVYTVPLSRS